MMGAGFGRAGDGDVAVGGRRLDVDRDRNDTLVDEYVAWMGSLDQGQASAPLLRLPELLLKIGIGGVPICRAHHSIGPGSGILRAAQAQVELRELRHRRWIEIVRRCGRSARRGGLPRRGPGSAWPARASRSPSTSPASAISRTRPRRAPRCPATRTCARPPGSRPSGRPARRRSRRRASRGAPAVRRCAAVERDAPAALGQRTRHQLGQQRRRPARARRARRRCRRGRPAASASVGLEAADELALVSPCCSGRARSAPCSSAMRGATICSGLVDAAEVAQQARDLAVDVGHQELHVLVLVRCPGARSAARSWLSRRRSPRRSDPARPARARSSRWCSRC